MVQVVAAIIERDGRILICRRTREQSHALKWEFPGGKVEPGETPEQAVERELEEELGIDGILFELNFGAAIPAEMMMRSLQLLCEKVMPHFK